MSFVVSHVCSSSYHSSDLGRKDEQEQVIVARYLSSLKLPDMSKSGHREKGKSQKEMFQVKGDVIPYGVSWPSYRMQHQNSTYSYFPPEWVMHESYRLGVPQQQSHFLSLPSTPTSIPRPRFFPFIPSMFRPDIGSIFWAREQEPAVPIVQELGPFLYLSNNLLPVPDRNDSHVTIEEIEENCPIQEEWLNKDATPPCRRDNFPSSVSGISTLDASNHPQSRYSSLGAELLERKYGNMKVQLTNETSSQPINKNKEFSWLPPGFINNRHNAIEAGEAPPSLMSSGSLRTDVQHLPPKVASFPRNMKDLVGQTNVSGVTGRNGGTFSSTGFPPEVLNRSLPVSAARRNAVFTGSTRPRMEGTKHLRPMPCANQMAPAVQIRTVTPVCSSPVRRMPSPPARKGLLQGMR